MKTQNSTQSSDTTFLPETRQLTDAGFGTKSRINVDSARVCEAPDQNAQSIAIHQARELHFEVWPKAFSASIQIRMFDKLRADPDKEDSAESFLNKLTADLKDGPQRSQLRSIIIMAFHGQSGPFADLSTQLPSSELTSLTKERLASLAVYQENHPFTQLQIIRNAEGIAQYCFDQIMTEKGQLEALKKLVPDMGMSYRALKDDLLANAISPKIKTEILHRYSRQATPFN